MRLAYRREAGIGRLGQERFGDRDARIKRTLVDSRTMVTNKRLRWIGLGLCCAVVLILGTAISIQGAGAWTAAATCSGDGNTKQDAAPFAIRGAKVRFLSTGQPNSSGPVLFLAQMFPLTVQENR